MIGSSDATVNPMHSAHTQNARKDAIEGVSGHMVAVVNGVRLERRGGQLTSTYVRGKSGRVNTVELGYRANESSHTNIWI